MNIYTNLIEGNGDNNFILIHNAGGNSQFFTYQIETLKHFGNIISLDLPGHGQSKNDTSDFTMESLASSIEDITTFYQLDKVSIIGLNNGADIAIEVLNRRNVLVTSLVLIDPPIIMEKSFVKEIKQFILALESSNYAEFVNQLADGLFIQTDIKTKQIAKDAFLTVDHKALQKVFSGLIQWDETSLDKLKQIDVPTLCILTDEHHCQYDKLKHYASSIQLGKVIGSKCWATLEVPDQVNAMIRRFIETIGLN
ncbi:alpha/beta hydrolase [Thiotrichales bacterium 19S9-12]|nr:alpha/beta hydrolase [Thiotrichales bacterium 19S9-11]MCF6811990.1 alpha/beta hydrolase [Thiotrichales bacterium 19S9-12]